MKLKYFDIIIILLATILIGFSIYSAYFKSAGAAYIIIQGQNTEWIFNNDAEETIAVTGPIGETIVRVSGGLAWVESSPCENQNCVVQGFVRRQGQWAACLPNQVLVIIKGNSKDDEPDAVSR